MSKSEDKKILENSFRWLNSGKSIVIDMPLEIAPVNNWQKEITTGKVSCESSFDSTTRIQKIDFVYHENNGEPFGIYDPYDKSKFDGRGIVRYIYPKSELIGMLTQIGFQVAEIPHYYDNGYFGLRGIKP